MFSSRLHAYWQGRFRSSSKSHHQVNSPEEPKSLLRLFLTSELRKRSGTEQTRYFPPSLLFRRAGYSGGPTDRRFESLQVFKKVSDLEAHRRAALPTCPQGRFYWSSTTHPHLHRCNSHRERRFSSTSQNPDLGHFAALRATRRHSRHQAFT